ncbi:MAG TPA: hypothetical protein VMW48_06765 [Vicinamibacterales bacterium]|nr:hypothetical protein [Vicinamibacterales bacterium]
MRRLFSRFFATALTGMAVLPMVLGPDCAFAQTPPIVLGATVAQRHEAARALVPLLKDVKAHAQPGATARPGTAPNSPFTGQPSTLFAFTLSKRSVPVDPRVVEAMDRLLMWNIAASDTSDADDNTQLFDRWLVELEARSSGVLRLRGEAGLCDVNCVVSRMTTLDGTWGSSPKNRADVRDEMILEALKAAVLTK